MRTDQERGPRSEKMPKCESLASHRACSGVLRKLWPKPVSLSCHQPTALSNHVPRGQGKDQGSPVSPRLSASPAVQLPGCKHSFGPW